MYFNPSDRRVFVPKRFGVGYTLNLGNPISWFITAALIAVIVYFRFLRTGAGSSVFHLGQPWGLVIAGGVVILVLLIRALR